MVRERFFSNARRGFIARSMMDIVKLLSVAGVVGGFFLSAPLMLRVGSAATLILGFFISVLTFPRKEKEEG